MFVYRSHQSPRKCICTGRRPEFSQAKADDKTEKGDADHSRHLSERPDHLVSSRHLLGKPITLSPFAMRYNIIPRAEK